MYHLSFYEDGRFVCFLGGEIATLPSAIENLDHMKSIIDNPQVISNTSIKYDRHGTTCAIIITDRWNQPIYEAKFQGSDSDTLVDEPIKELNPDE
jgi:hypothetical protein